MKKFKILFTTILISSLSLAAETIIQGTSMGKYLKPGAPVQITYSTEHVNIGESSKVNIILTSTATTGRMTVNMSIGKVLNTKTKRNKKIFFDLSPIKKEYPINLSVSSQKEGLYYIRLQVDIEGKGMRAFAVPVSIGNTKSNQIKKTLLKDAHGRNLSISNAIETIR